MKQLSLAVKREISVFPFSLITAACWWLWSGCSFGPLSHSREQAAAEPNTQTSKPGFDWKSEIQALDQLLSKSVLFLGMVTGCLKLRKKENAVCYTWQPQHESRTTFLGSYSQDQGTSRKVAEILSRQQNDFRFSPDIKMTSINLCTDRLFQGIFVNGLGNSN